MTKKQTVTKRKVVEEVKAIPADTAEPLDTLIGRVYLIVPGGLQAIEMPDAEEHIRAIQKAAKDYPDGDLPFTFYEGGKPVYMAIKNGKYEALAFPEPGPHVNEGQIGMTSVRLYSLAETLASTIEKIIELETEPKPSLLDQAKKIMTPTIAIVACVLVIFLILVVMKG